MFWSRRKSWNLSGGAWRRRGSPIPGLISGSLRSMAIFCMLTCRPSGSLCHYSADAQTTSTKLQPVSILTEEYTRRRLKPCKMITPHCGSRCLTFSNSLRRWWKCNEPGSGFTLPGNYDFGVFCPQVAYMG